MKGARAVLSVTAAIWFGVAAVGQLAFAAYIAVFYGPTAISGDYAQWARNENLIDGYKAGDGLGNGQFLAHVLVALIITLAGIAQFLPALRRAAPALHRWCGRVFLIGALIASVNGLWLVWGRGTHLTVSNSIAISLNGVLIILFAWCAWRAALRRDFAPHQAWAFRLWLAVSGVWFLRVGMAAFGIVTMAFLGMEAPPFDAFFAFWGFGSYLVPLALYELYRLARDRGGANAKSAMAAILIVLSVLMGSGIFGVILGQWAPLMLAR